MIIKNVENLKYILVSGSDEIEYSDIVYDSRKVTEGCLFICIKGMRYDSHDDADKILKAGAKGLIIQRSVDLDSPDANVYLVDDTREALSLCARALFDYPEKKLTTVAITGTKGKTTTACMVKELIEKAGYSCGLIGTLGIDIGKKHIPTMNTTPESFDIQKAMYDMVNEGCKYLVMEASSQAFLMKRVAGIMYDYAVFTNISNDHIGDGEHKDFQDYLDCKTQLFRQCKCAFLNADDEHTDYIIRSSGIKNYKTFGMKNAADYTYSDIEYKQDESFMGLSFKCNIDGNDYNCVVSLPGKFNAPNAMGALCVAHALGFNKEIIEQGLSRLFVSGRMELVYSTKDLKVIVDFAHNEVSTINLLETLRQYEHKRLVVVFGCGGNRSPERRYGMGKVCAQYADFSVITEDNNRLESIEDIMKDIHSTFDPAGGVGIDIPLRPDAVKYVIDNHEPGDLVAIIGKGHEDYIDKEGKRTHYSDQEAVKEALVQLGLN